MPGKLVKQAICNDNICFSQRSDRTPVNNNDCAPAGLHSMPQFPRLTDADLLGIEGLAAVVGRPREVERRGVGGARSGAHQDEGELTQHT